MPSSVLPATRRDEGYVALSARRSSRVVGRHHVASPLWIRSALAGLRSSSGKGGSAAAAALPRAERAERAEQRGRGVSRGAWLDRRR
eukprot:1952511-Prymnesium_polylepis.1